MTRTTLYYQDSRSDKEYTVAIEPHGSLFKVTAYYGKRGGPQATAPKGDGLSLADAKTIQTRTLNEKRAKGYREGPDAEPIQQTDREWVASKSATVTPEILANLPSVMLLNECNDTECKAMLDHPKWMAQAKSDGHRCRITVDHGRVSGDSRLGNAKTLPQSLIKYLSDKFSNALVVLDGELVDNLYVVFDILVLNEKELWREHAEVRSARVTQMFKVSDAPAIATVTAYTQVEKHALFAAVYKEGCEGSC